MDSITGQGEGSTRPPGPVRLRRPGQSRSGDIGRVVSYRMGGPLARWHSVAAAMRAVKGESAVAWRRFDQGRGAMEVSLQGRTA